MRLLFHGTSHIIKDLTSAYIGKGGDPNSSLGFHTTDGPYVAAEYADISIKSKDSKEARKVIAVLADIKKSYIEESFEEFFGIDEMGERFKTHRDFALWRDALIDSGYDALEMDGHEDEIVVLLDPASSAFKIVAELSYDEAIALHERYEEEGLVYEDTDRRVELLKETILQRQAEHVVEGLSP